MRTATAVTAIEHRDGGYVLRLADGEALLADLLRQQGAGQLQLVLHLHLRRVGVDAVGEGQGDGRLAVGLAGGGHVAQAIEAVHLLLDDLDHGHDDLPVVVAEDPLTAVVRGVGKMLDDLDLLRKVAIH